MSTIHPIPRHANFQNLTGKKFGRLTVISFAGKRLRRSTWNCLCECGGHSSPFAQHLKEGISTSCGCRQIEVTAARNKTHGMSKIPEYRVWKAIKRRCYNKNTKDYPLYGGRGITVCERWLDSFEKFFADMGTRPSPVHSIDRFPNNDGNYEPGNCRWATPKEQSNNSRRWKASV